MSAAPTSFFIFINYYFLFLYRVFSSVPSWSLRGQTTIGAFQAVCTVNVEGSLELEEMCPK